MSTAVLPQATHSPRLADVEARTLTTDDGVELYYEVLEADRPGAPVLLLANGLGGKLYAWEPFLERFGGTHRIITWDYRGLFRSSMPTHPKALSIPFHAADAVRILDVEGVERATLVGWSMGVQVSLETALQSPLRVERLVLINGTYGHVFQTGLQPVMRLPGFPRLLHSTVERLTAHGSLMGRVVRAVARSELHLVLVGTVLGRVFGNPRINDMYRQYNVDVFGDSFETYMRLFQELDAHSVYHLLGEILQPTLVVSGRLDWLTPATLSFAIARRMPNAEHLHMTLASHFALLEHTDRVLVRIGEFLGA